MPERFFKRISNKIKHWYLPLIGGIVLIAIGFWTFNNKAETYTTLAFLFSLSFIFAGVLETLFALANRRLSSGWGWDLAMGLLTLTVGLLMIARPEVSMITLPFYIGFVVMFRSMSAIAMALDLRNYGARYGGLLFMGVLGLVFSFILLWNPKFAGLTIVVYTGITLIVAGIAAIMYSMVLKKIHTFSKAVSQELMDRYNAIEAEIENEINANNAN